MKHLLLFLISIVSFNRTDAQPNEPKYILRVVPFEGVNLRESPNLESKVILTIPFAQQVKVYDIVRFDTIIDNRNGNWVKAKYQQHQGYIFSGFLEDFQYVEADSLNRIFRIQPPGLIITELSYEPDLYWYGLFLNSLKSSFELQYVDIKILSYKSVNDPVGCAELSIETTTLNNRPQFFLGSIIPLETGTSNNLGNDIKWPGYSSSLNKKSECDFNLGQLAYTLRLEGAVGNRNLNLTLNRTKQQIHPHGFNHKYVSLEYAGDLDGDQELDIILNLFNDTGDGGQGGTYYLYLSTEAKNNELVKLVATYNWSTGGCD